MFGLRAIFIIATCAISAVISEYAFQKIAKKEKIEMAPTVTINGKMVEDPLDKNDLFKKLNNELKK